MRPLIGPAVARGRCSAFLATEDQKRAADHDGADAGPDRHVDGLLVLDRQLDRSDLCLVSLLGEAEAAVHQPQDAGFAVNGEQHLIIASDHNQGVFVPLELTRPFKMPSVLRRMKRFAAVDLSRATEAEEAE